MQRNLNNLISENGVPESGTSKTINQTIFLQCDTDQDETR